MKKSTEPLRLIKPPDHEPELARFDRIAELIPWPRRAVRLADLIDQINRSGRDRDRSELPDLPPAS